MSAIKGRLATQNTCHQGLSVHSRIPTILIHPVSSSYHLQSPWGPHPFPEDPSTYIRSPQEKTCKLKHVLTIAITPPISPARLGMHRQLSSLAYYQISGFFSKSKPIETYTPSSPPRSRTGDMSLCYTQ